MNSALLARLRLFQITSPALPIGAFTYSQGMEWAVECGWLRTADDTRAWLDTALDESLRCLELPIMIRLYRALAENSPQQFNHWSQYLLASRETSELRMEECQRAQAFYDVLYKLPDDDKGDINASLCDYREGLLKSQTAGFTFAASRWGVLLEEQLAGYSWSWLENGVNAAIKLVPLGQSAGQSLLFQLSEKIPAIIASAQTIEDDVLGASTPALAIASSLHETQYCRLFRS